MANHRKQPPTTANNRKQRPKATPRPKPGPRPDVSARATLKTARDRHHAYARGLFAGHSQYDAWADIYDPQRLKPRRNAYAKASDLAKHPAVIDELTRLRQEHAVRLKQEADEAARLKQEALEAAVASRHEIEVFHTRVMRASSSEFTAENKDLILLVERKTLAPPKIDRQTGEEIPNPDADEEGYVTSIERRPPNIKERQKSAVALATLRGYTKAEDKRTTDDLLDLLIAIRGGGKE